VPSIRILLLIVLVDALAVCKVLSDLAVVVAAVAVGVPALAVGDAVDEAAVVG
jgi:hypothetical protein